MTNDITAWAPCPGNEGTLTSAAAPALYQYVCSSLGAPAATRKQQQAAAEQVLEIALAPTLEATDFTSGVVTVVPDGPSPGPCSPATRICGLTTTRTVWTYNQAGQDLGPAYPGGPAFYNPLYPTSSPGWSSGQGLFGPGWCSDMQTSLVRAGPPYWTQTDYFRTTFNLTRTACYTGLYLDLVVKDGAILYLNNVEIGRINMPDGPVTNNTRATVYTFGITGLSCPYSSFYLPLTGSGLKYSLYEGINYLAAELHNNGSDLAFSVRASAEIQTSCSGRIVKPEICDGIDNNNDGNVDVDPATGSLLKRPCWTACGSGFETCTRGIYQSCSAPPVYQERCNGIDDDCDG